MLIKKLIMGTLVGIFLTASALPVFPSPQKVKLVIAGRDGTYGKAMELAAKTYMKENPTIEMELLKLPWAGLYEKVVIDLREAVGAYDVVMLDDTWATEFMGVGWLENLNKLFEQKNMPLDPDFVDQTVDVGRYPYLPGIGTLYALPHVGNVELFAYRKDLFAKYGLTYPPKTWSDVLAAAKKINEEEPEIHGIVFRGKKGNPIVAGFLPMFWAFGAKIVDQKGKPSVDSSQGIAALKFFLELKKYAPTGVEIYNASEVRDALLSGTAAMAPEVWPAWVPDLDNPEKSKVVGKMEIISPPGQKVESSPMIGIWLLGIPKAAKRKDSALDFLSFVTSKRIQKLMALEVGLPPTRESLYQDPELISKYRWYPAQLEALKSSKPRPRVVQWTQIEATLGTYLQLALVGDMTPEQALNEANAKIADILE
jgi:multiple sugar transport system substrate-binding protein